MKHPEENVGTLGINFSDEDFKAIDVILERLCISGEHYGEQMGKRMNKD